MRGVAPPRGLGAFRSDARERVKGGAKTRRRQRTQARQVGTSSSRLTSVCLAFLPVNSLSASLSIFLSFFLSLPWHLSVCVSAARLFTWLLVSLPVCGSVSPASCLLSLASSFSSIIPLSLAQCSSVRSLLASRSPSLVWVCLSISTHFFV